jgi:hypothetical protein
MIVNPSINFRTRSALQHALHSGQEVRVWSPSGVQPKRFGIVDIQGPWGSPVQWSATVLLEKGVVVSIRP